MEEWTKTLPEDTIEYALYAFPQKNRLGSNSKSATKELLKEVRKAATQLTDQHLKDYIWQRDSFALTLRDNGKDNAGEVHLHGQTNFGDSIEDEWLIVWLLRELGKQFSQLWIKATDSMGEFLLVEAANVLPAWIDPEIAENRVWLNKGELRLIPLAAPRKGDGTQPPPGPLALDQARQHIYDEKPTLHPALVEKEAFHRLRNYPAQIQKNQHHALVTIPRRLAYLLHETPAYIGGAVDAFYLRDPIAMKPLMASDQGGLIFPPRDFATVRVRFTRVGYAQLKSQRFGAPASWDGAERGYDDARLRDRAEMGMKVTAGFEMLLNDPQRQDDRNVREMKMLMEDVDGGDMELPTDEEIESWGLEADDEKWMDIDFQDFENELSGGKGAAAGLSGGSKGFGDKAAQENLRKMVSRFEDFLKDDTLGPDDVDDDDDEDEDESDGDVEGEDKDGSFTEDEFTKMMCEMMGMPQDVMHEIMTGKMPEDEIKRFAEEAQKREHVSNPGDAKGKGKVQDEDDAEDDEEIRELSAAMERELRGVGALDISGPEEATSLMSNKNKVKAETLVDDEDEDARDGDDDDGELLDEDYNLVANMLESFKNQAGKAGPGGNLMSMLGMQMPRDEGDNEEHEAGPAS